MQKNAQTGFLDISKKLRSRKTDNSKIKYINKKSNHPKNIGKTINPMIFIRPSNLWSNKYVYSNEKNFYNEEFCFS